MQQEHEAHSGEWRDWPLERLGLNDRTLAAFKEDGVATIGELHDLESYGKLEDEVLRAFSVFWENNPGMAETQEDEVSRTADERTMSELDWRIRSFNAMQAQSEEIDRLEHEWRDAKDRVKELKRELDAASARLRRMGLAKDDGQRVLFDSNAEIDPSFEVVEDRNADWWKGVPVEEAIPCLTARMKDVLEDAGIKTMGQFEDLRGGEGIVSLSGFGRATADKLEAWALEWLTENRDRFGEEIPFASDDVDTEDNEIA